MVSKEKLKDSFLMDHTLFFHFQICNALRRSTPALYIRMCLWGVHLVPFQAKTIYFSACFLSVNLETENKSCKNTKISTFSTFSITLLLKAWPISVLSLNYSSSWNRWNRWVPFCTESIIHVVLLRLPIPCTGWGRSRFTFVRTRNAVYPCTVIY